MAEAVRRPRLSLTQQIFIGLGLGVLLGWFVNVYHPDWVNNIRPFSQIFLRMIKMVIAPLIFATLVAGIAGAGHFKQVGRMGLKAIIYFEIVTTIALILGLVAVNLVKPGVGLQLPTEPSGITGTAQTWREILLHLVPESVIQAMATGDVLQIVVFSIIFGIALGILGEKGRPMVQWCEILAETMFKFTNIVMHYAPIGVGAAMAYTVGHGGLAVLKNLGLLVLTLYGALIVFFLIVLLPIAIIFKVPLRKFFRAVREPAVIAFSTTSSEAALPRAMEVLERLGVPRRIVSFILPLGYSFNLDGTTLYLSLAAVFVAQAAGVELDDRPADHDAPDADAHEQGRRGCTARLARHPRRHARQLQPAARRHHADPGRGRAHGHGADDDERRRQLPGDRRRRQVGRRVQGSERRRARRGGRARRDMTSGVVSTLFVKRHPMSVTAARIVQALYEMGCALRLADRFACLPLARHAVSRPGRVRQDQ